MTHFQRLYACGPLDVYVLKQPLLIESFKVIIRWATGFDIAYRTRNIEFTTINIQIVTNKNLFSFTLREYKY